jgi:hypothetical protein
MQIASFSSIAPISSLSSTPAKAPVAKAETAAAPAATEVSSGTTTKSAPASAASTSRGGGRGGDSAGTASTSEQLVAEYATTVGGKSYGGSVEKSGDSYTATASGLAGASASGASIDAAENNLGALIDVLA